MPSPDVVVAQQELARAALEAAAALGHQMGRWSAAGPSARRAACRRCGRQIWQSTTALFAKPHGPALDSLCEGGR